MLLFKIALLFQKGKTFFLIASLMVAVYFLMNEQYESIVFFIFMSLYLWVSLSMLMPKLNSFETQSFFFSSVSQKKLVKDLVTNAQTNSVSLKTYLSLVGYLDNFNAKEQEKTAPHNAIEIRHSIKELEKELTKG